MGYGIYPGRGVIESRRSQRDMIRDTFEGSDYDCDGSCNNREEGVLPGN